MEGVKVMDDALSNLKVVKRNGKKVDEWGMVLNPGSCVEISLIYDGVYAAYVS